MLSNKAINEKKKRYGLNILPIYAVQQFQTGATFLN